MISNITNGQGMEQVEGAGLNLICLQKGLATCMRTHSHTLFVVSLPLVA